MRFLKKDNIPEDWRECFASSNLNTDIKLERYLVALLNDLVKSKDEKSFCTCLCIENLLQRLSSNNGMDTKGDGICISIPKVHFLQEDVLFHIRDLRLKNSSVVVNLTKQSPFATITFRYYSSCSPSLSIIKLYKHYNTNNIYQRYNINLYYINSSLATA